MMDGDRGSDSVLLKFRKPPFIPAPRSHPDADSKLMLKNMFRRIFEVFIA